jgi:hypothetical protein
MKLSPVLHKAVRCAVLRRPSTQKQRRRSVKVLKGMDEPGGARKEQQGRLGLRLGGSKEVRGEARIVESVALPAIVRSLDIFKRGTVEVCAY